MKRLIQIILTLSFVIALHTTAFAQPPLPGHGQPEDQPAPIGGGLALLLAMGAAYGAKKVYDARKRLNG